MLDQNGALKILDDLDVIQHGHFLLSSGRHSEVYVAKKKLYADLWQTERICRAIALPFINDCIDVVVGPESGGAYIAKLITQLLLRRKPSNNTIAIAARKHPDKTFSVEENKEGLLRGKNVLVVDDIVTTGGTLRGVIEMVRKNNGNVVSVGVMFDRGNVLKKPLEEPLKDIHKVFAFISVYYPDWEEPCPQCKQGIPLSPTPGKE